MFLLYFLQAVTLVSMVKGQGPPVGSCQCIANLDSYNSTANVRENPCGTVIKSHNMGACFQATGDFSTCEIAGTEHTFYQVIYDIQGTLAWISQEYLEESDSVKCEGMGQSCDDAEFVSRDEWGARPPKQTTPIAPPLSAMFVHHSAMDHCYTKEDCILRVREIQDLHMDDRGFDDIGYNFLIGEDGRIYEGRGWNNRGAHARQHNDWSYGVCIMGNFMEVEPRASALNAVKSIMQCGVNELTLTPGYEVFGHRDGVCTECPGDRVYDNITTWNYYSNRDIPILC